MNVYFIIGMITAIALVIGAWRLYRLYKNEGRICPVCGNRHVGRISFIELPDEEVGLTLPFIVRKDSLPLKPSSLFLAIACAWSLASRHMYRNALSLCAHWFIEAAVWVVIARIFKGWPRWFVWGAQRFTFSDCPPCEKHDYRRIKIVRITFRDEPITLWHLWCVKWRDRRQFDMMPMEFKLAIDVGIKPIYHSGAIELPDDVEQQPDIVTPLVKSAENAVKAITEFGG